VALFYDKEIRIFRTLCGSDNNNAYLVVCPDTKESVIIDAPLGPEGILEHAEGTQVKAILITHRHRDHTEGLEQVVKTTRAPVLAHPADVPEIPGAPIPIEDGEIIKVGTLEIKAIHTPGHTPGSICFLVCGHIFTGDTVYSGGPGESRGPEATIQILKNITEKIYTLPDETVVLPGHGHHSILSIPKREYRMFYSEHPDILPPIPPSKR
jgi:glyoxylase-like metal-dependent hydrolase (beta-lactamase superfamily II)